MSRAQIRILTVDDHPLLRAEITGLISDEPDMVLVAEAENGRDAIEGFTRDQVRNIHAKLGANDRTRAAVLGIKRGITHAVVIAQTRGIIEL